MITLCPAIFAFLLVFVLPHLSLFGPIWLRLVFAFVFVLSFLSLLGSAWLTCAQLYLGVNSPIACVALTLCGNLHPSVHMDDVDLYWLQVQLYVHTCIGCKCFFSLFTPLPLHFNMTRPSLRWERSEEIFAHGDLVLKWRAMSISINSRQTADSWQLLHLWQRFCHDLLCCGPLSCNLVVTFSSKDLLEQRQ